MIDIRFAYRPLLLAALVACAQIVHGDETLRIDSVLLELIEQADVPARDPGVIEAISVKEGNLVNKGDTLVQLDITEPRLEVGRAKLELGIARQESKNDVDVRFAEKSLEVAEAELQRALDSVADYPKSVSQTELDRLKLTAERTRLEIEQAKHVLIVADMNAQLAQNALETAESKFDRQTIRAPIDGVVVQVYRRSGEWVEPGQQVVRLLRMDRLRAEGFVDSLEIDEFPVGSPIELQTMAGKGPAKTFTGKLVFVSPEVDPVNNQVRVWAEVDNPHMQLKPGMSAAMVVMAKEAPDPESELESEADDEAAE